MEPLDAIKDISSCYITGPISASADSIVFHSREEALHHRVMVALAEATHAALDAMVGQQFLELLTRILAVVVTMTQELGIRPAPPDRHDQRVGHEVGSHA